MNNPPFLSVCAFALASCTLAPAHADERLKGIACRSVHLSYPAAEAKVFYNEITIDHSADGTYFMVCGWSKGYFGLQELANGKKLIVFSVWDPGQQDDPKAVAEDRRVKLMHKDDKVRVGRFGGEGTGGQSFFDYDWKAGVRYRFMVAAKSDGTQRTEYAGWFFVPEEKQWKHLVTFSTLSEGQLLRGCYSFVEDFRRNRVSTTKVRQARFGNGWIQTPNDSWTALAKARFTADGNPVMNINAGLDGGFFFLATGGETRNANVKLGATMSLPNVERRQSRPDDLPRNRD